MKKNEVKIGAKNIGNDNPCYLILEVGTTHLGDVNKALKLIEAGSMAGADAIKFQLIDPYQISNSEISYKYKLGDRNMEQNMQSMFERLAFTKEQWLIIKKACEVNNVHFFATVDYEEGVDLLEEINVPVHKMGGWDITFKQLIEKIAKTGKPMFIDLGGSEEEVNQCVEWFENAGGKTILFMHDFHTEQEDQMNMRAISYLQDKYPWPVGFSSPGRDDDLDLLALGLGVSYIEKRLILSRNDEAYHAHQSLEPDEMKIWIDKIRKAERTLGSKKIKQTDADRKMSLDYYRSICALKDIKKGEYFSFQNIGSKRPGTGIAVAKIDEYIGRLAKKNIMKNTLIKEGDKN